MSYAIKLLGEICEISTGSTDTKDATENGQYPLFDRSKKVKASEKYLFDCEALIMPGEGAEFLPRHYIGKFDLHQRAYAIFNFSNLVDPQYLYYYLIFVKDYFANNAVGATVKSLRRRHFTDLKVPLPSLEKQREIVEKLDSAFAEIDRLSENSLVSLNSVKSLIGRLVDSWIKTVSSGQTAPLGDLAELKGRIGWRGLTAKEYTKSGPLFLSVHSLNHGHFVDFSRAFHVSQDRYDESPEIHLKEGYILIAKDGAGLGKVAMVGAVTEPTTVNSSLLVVKPKREIETKYLYCYFLSPDFKNLIADRLGGSTVPHLYQRDIAKIPIALLTPKQQVEFIKKFDTGSKLMENLSSNLERRRSLITQLKESILAVEFEAVA